MRGGENGTMDRTRRRTTALALVLAATWMVVPRAQAAEIEGVSFPETTEWRDTALVLHGTGLMRYRYVIKAYVAALYLGERVDAEDVLDDVPRRLEIEYFWGIPAEAFARVTFEGIARNRGEAAAERMREAIDALSRLYADVAPGDRYALTYVPGVGTELSLNGVPRGVVEGAEFSSALFAIWLGEQPFDEALREQLLRSS